MTLAALGEMLLGISAPSPCRHTHIYTSSDPQIHCHTNEHLPFLKVTFRAVACIMAQLYAVLEVAFY